MSLFPYLKDPTPISTGLSRLGISKFGEMVFSIRPVVHPSNYPQTIDDGALTIWSTIWTADRDGTIKEDVTDYLVAGSIEYDTTRSTRLSGRFTFRQGVVKSFTDFIVPKLYVQDSNGVISEGQLGLLGFELPEKEVDLQNTTISFDAMDLTWILSTAKFRSPWTVLQGVTIVSAVIDILESVGITHYKLADPGIKMSSKLTFPIGTSLMDATTFLLQMIGWESLNPMSNGALTSGLVTEKVPEETYTIFTADNMYSPPRVSPVLKAVPNVIIVSKDDPSEDPIVVVEVNDDPKSITSTVYTRIEVPYEVSNPGFTSIAEMRVLAKVLLEQFKKLRHTMSIDILPDPNIMNMRVVTVDYDTPEECLCGKYAVSKWSVGLDESKPLITLSLDMLTATDHIAEVQVA